MYTVDELKRTMRSLSSRRIETQTCEYHDYLKIMRVVCKTLGISPQTLGSSLKTTAVVEARMIAAVLLKQAGFTNQQIAKGINRDRTTLIHYNDRFKTLIGLGDHLKTNYLKAKEALKNEN